MPKVQTICPNCNQPMIAELTQVVDVGINPELKQALLSGQLNTAQCQVCGFQGQIPVPLVYHDPDKEILLTFSPAGAGKSMEEKQGALAPLLQRVVDALPPEQRKGYLFQPQEMLTMNSLVKTVLKEDGITEEMIEQQQKKMALLEKLFTQNQEQLVETVRSNEEMIDQEFFALFTEIAQRILASQDQNAIQKIRLIQEKLLEETELGRKIDLERKDLQAAQEKLEKLGENLSRSSLLDLVINAPSEGQVKALTSLARPAMDYNFFELFTELIEAAEGTRRNQLVERRNKILKWTQEIDQAINQRVNAARGVLQTILEEDEPGEALRKNLASIDEYFLQALGQEMEQAKQDQDPDRTRKLEQILHEIEAITTPPELKIIDQLLAAAEEEEELIKKIDELDQDINSDLVSYLTSILNNYQQQIEQSQGDQEEELQESFQLLQKVHNAVIRRSMRKKMTESGKQDQG